MESTNKRCCSYCDREWNERDEACAHCGAPSKYNGLAKYDPFTYKEYVIYSFRDYSRLCFNFRFYKGTKLIGDVIIKDEEVFSISPTDDIMPLVEKRLNGIMD